jgi:hypothetical protein
MVKVMNVYRSLSSYEESEKSAPGCALEHYYQHNQHLVKVDPVVWPTP